MTDGRFNSIHLGRNPRRDEYRRARARLQTACGHETLAVEQAKGTAELGSPTLIAKDLNEVAVPTECHFWLADAEAVYPLEVGLNSIGRMPDNDVVVADASVSRRHCAIIVHARRGCELHDTASRNGTFLNGQRLTRPTYLRPGDQIRMSDRVLTLWSDAQPEAPYPLGHEPTCTGS